MHLDVFDQPVKNYFFNNLLEVFLVNLPTIDAMNDLSFPPRIEYRAGMQPFNC